jgi:hypothetical protein
MRTLSASAHLVTPQGHRPESNAFAALPARRTRVVTAEPDTGSSISRNVRTRRTAIRCNAI